MHLVTTSSPRLLGIALVTGLVALRCSGDKLHHAVTIESLDGDKGFGATFAADGSAILTVDRRCNGGGRRCSIIVRFGEFVANRVVESMQFSAGWHLAGLDVNRDTAVIRSGFGSDDTLHFFTRDRARQWTAGQELAIEASCVAHYYPNVQLGEAVLVVESDLAWCIYVRGEAGWRYDSQLDHEGGRAIRLSGDQVVEVDGNGAKVFARAPDGWHLAQRIDPPTGVTFDWTRVAVTDRWLIALGSTQPEDGTTYEVYVVALETGEFIARLPSQLDDDDFAAKIAASATTIVAIGAHDQRWELAGRAWRPRGVIEGTSDRSASMARDVAIADLIWLGDPVESPSARGGRVHGFRHD
jgi:hypothetical protein